MKLCSSHHEGFVAVGGECVTRVRGEVHHSLVTEGRHRHAVPVGRDAQLLIGGEFAVFPGGAKHVECVLHLREHLAPEVNGVAVIERGDVGNYMVLY